MNEKLKLFKIEIDDIENIDFENSMLQKIARQCADEMDLKRFELVLNENIITAKDKFTGIHSYMAMRVSLEPLEKDISFIVRPTNEPTYEDLSKENKILKENAENNDKVVDKVNWENMLLKKENKKYKTQQKEFIKYMNDIIEDLETEDVDDEEMKGYLIQRIDTFKEILQKYEEIVGGKHE